MTKKKPPPPPAQVVMSTADLHSLITRAADRPVMIDQHEVRRITGFGRTRIHEFRVAKSFPLPVRTNGRIRFVESEIYDWNRARMATR